MKLYTKTGDDGTTGLLGGQRVPKDSLRIHLCGEVDELNCAVGLGRAICNHEMISLILEQVQRTLFDLGAVLAGQSQEGAVKIGAEQIAWAEKKIDMACSSVEPMKYFILPGGGVLAARLHLARAVCRRAERLCVTLSREESVSEDVLIYLNRLSDLLFALARWANHLDGVEDIAWEGNG